MIPSPANPNRVASKREMLRWYRERFIEQILEINEPTIDGRAREARKILKAYEQEVRRLR